MLHHTCTESATVQLLSGLGKEAHTSGCTVKATVQLLTGIAQVTVKTSVLSFPPVIDWFKEDTICFFSTNEFNFLFFMSIRFKFIYKCSKKYIAVK